jgi:BirA family transcriptional regulator, biotin operon repressor / biotin---[acetyl-CoA-carboxylase] ligase
MVPMIHFKIENHNEVASTNSLLLERAGQGASEGLVLTATCQTAGRGKPGRQWVSPAGKNLLCSILLRPPLSPAQAPMLTQIACRAVAKVLKEKYDISSEFKRPNDVMVGSRKICGILVEALSTPSRLGAVVIGIGLNVNAKSEELPPEGVSMAELRPQVYSIQNILSHILDEMALKVDELYKTGSIK